MASSSANPEGPPPLTAIWLAALGTNVSFSIAALSNTPTALEPKAATYRVPSLASAMSIGVARLASLTPAGIGIVR